MSNLSLDCTCGRHVDKFCINKWLTVGSDPDHVPDESLVWSYFVTVGDVPGTLY